MEQNEVLAILNNVVANNQQYTTWTVSTPHLVGLVNEAMKRERSHMLQFIDEFTGAEQERNPMFSEGYDLALLHMKQLIEGRS